MVSTSESSRICVDTSLAASATPSAFVAIIYRSHGAISSSDVAAVMLVTVLSPLAPSSLSPDALIASICSAHLSIANTFSPLSAINAA